MGSNNKGQITLGTFILMSVGIIFALALFTGGITSNIGVMTNKVNYVNVTYTAPAEAGASITLSGQANTNVIVINATSGTVIPASNYTITNYVVNNGVLTSTLTANAGNTLGWHGKGINVSSTVEPFGYETNSGSRAIISMIAVFAALAVVVFALWPVIGSRVLEMLD
jgi:hypothetical protein